MTIRKNNFAFGVMLISASLLALEILYVRFVSILLYPVATYLVISLALLGLGAGGGYLSLRRKGNFAPNIARLSALGFSFSVLLSMLSLWFAGSSSIAAILMPITLGLPMFFGGLTLSLAFSLPETNVPVLYFADLLGAGTAAGLVLIGLNYLTGIQVGLLIAIGGLVSALFFSSDHQRRSIIFFIIALFISLGFSVRLPAGISSIAAKELRLMLALGPQVEWEYQGWSPLARVDVLSLQDDPLSTELSVPYKLVTHDGGAPSLLLNVKDQDDSDAFISRTIFGLPYWIHDNPSVLIIGLGGGPDVLAGLAGGASKILGAEVNPEMIKIVENDFSDFTGDPYSNPRVDIRLTDGRHLLAASDELFDIIQLTGVDTTVASLGANPNLAENYLYTLEAFTQYLDHLTPSGALSVSFPNIDGLGLRLLALAAETLKIRDITPVEEHIVVSEMTGYVHILVSNRAFTDEDLKSIRNHYQMGPTSIYFPLYHRLFGVPGEDFIADRQILLAPDDNADNIYGDFITAHNLGNEKAFLAAQPQTVEPPTDNWPFFFVLDKIGFSAVNYETLRVTLGLLAIFSILLTLIPPWFLSRRGLTISRPSLLAVYFSSLGLGFIFVEVTLIQKLSLIVGHPSYSLAITLSALLISSGVGSLLSSKVEIPAAKKASGAALLIAALVVVANFGLDQFGSSILVQPLGLRLLLSAIIVAIPGIMMGVPFPTGLSVVKEIEARFVPWAWGLNATFTVIGTILALLLAMSSGFATVLNIAAILYLGAAFAIFMFFRD